MIEIRWSTPVAKPKCNLQLKNKSNIYHYILSWIVWIFIISWLYNLPIFFWSRYSSQCCMTAWTPCPKPYNEYLTNLASFLTHIIMTNFRVIVGFTRVRSYGPIFCTIIFAYHKSGRRFQFNRLSWKINDIKTVLLFNLIVSNAPPYGWWHIENIIVRMMFVSCQVLHYLCSL